MSEETDAHVSYELHLPVWKQGHDINSAKEASDGILETLESAAEQYKSVVKILEEIRDSIDENDLDVSISGDTHVIWLDGNKEDLEYLVEEHDNIEKREHPEY